MSTPITYSKTLDGLYTGKRVEYSGIFEGNGSFTLYENGEALKNLTNSAKLNYHYTDPNVMPYYNLASQLIYEGEKS